MKKYPVRKKILTQSQQQKYTRTTSIDAIVMYSLLTFVDFVFVQVSSKHSKATSVQIF